MLFYCQITTSLWPQPQQIHVENTYFSIQPKNFRFLLGETGDCDILNRAIQRYEQLTFLDDCSFLKNDDSTSFDELPNQTDLSGDRNYMGEIDNITVFLRTGGCEQWPSLNMDEMYTLRIDSPDYPKRAVLFANKVWGLIRGLETFSQLVNKVDGRFVVNTTFILDYPRFSHRGLLLDTSRHFIPKHILLENLDAMAYNKMNVCTHFTSTVQ